jgi:TetR/AcrR family transcriptional regulator, repressor for neighboring sulfatase
MVAGFSLSTSMSLRGKRRSQRGGDLVRPPDVRRQALSAARELLLTFGPSGVTLTAVADRIGRSHSVLIHHFGSAEELQSALMSSMVDDLAAALLKAFGTFEPTALCARALVDAVFDAFDEGGAGVLAAWIVLSNKQRHLDPVRAAVSQLADSVNRRLAAADPHRPRHVPSALLFLTLCAFADALVGEPLKAMLRMDEDAMRALAIQLLPRFFAADS